MNHPINLLVNSALEGLKSIADVNTIIGDAVEVGGGVTIIPVSKISLGFGIGGSDFKEPLNTENSNLFGGGGGGGVNIDPIAFLVINNGDVSLLPIEKGGGLNLADAIPAVVDFVKGFKKKKDN